MGIIELAISSGLINQHNEHMLQDKEVMFQLERFAALVQAEYEAPLKLAEEALGNSQQHLDLRNPKWVNVRRQNDKALAAIREALADQSKCACDSPAWCNQYKKCNREMLGLPKAEPAKPLTDEMLREIQEIGEMYPDGINRAEPVKQEPVAWRWSTHNGHAYAETHFDGEDGEPLYAAPVDAKAIRAEALEEAAKVCDEEAKAWARLNAQDEEGFGATQCAAAIRGLK